MFDAYKSWCSSNSEFQQYKHKPSLTRELVKKKYKVSFKVGRKSYLDGYELIVKEENQISQAEVEAVFEEEDDF